MQKIFYQEYFSAMQISGQFHSARWHITESDAVRSSKNIAPLSLACSTSALRSLNFGTVFIAFYAFLKKTLRRFQ